MNNTVIVFECLKELGVPANIKGYHYLKEAIQMTIEGEGILAPITKVVYPEIANKYNTTAARVERAMRHAIGIALNNADFNVLDKFFGVSIGSKNGNITNAEFVAIVANHILIHNS